MQDGSYFSRVLHTKMAQYLQTATKYFFAAVYLVSITTGLRCQYKGQNMEENIIIMTKKDSLFTMNSTFHSRRLTY